MGDYVNTQFSLCCNVFNKVPTYLPTYLSERSGEKLHTQELSRNQSIDHFDVMLQHDWPIEQCLLLIRVFFGGKTNSQGHTKIALMKFCV